MKSKEYKYLVREYSEAIQKCANIKPQNEREMYRSLAETIEECKGGLAQQENRLNVTESSTLGLYGGVLTRVTERIGEFFINLDIDKSKCLKIICCEGMNLSQLPPEKILSLDKKSSEYTEVANHYNKLINRFRSGEGIPSDERGKLLLTADVKLSNVAEKLSPLELMATSLRSSDMYEIFMAVTDQVIYMEKPEIRKKRLERKKRFGGKVE